MSCKTQHIGVYLKSLKMSSSVYGNFHKYWFGYPNTSWNYSQTPKLYTQNFCVQKNFGENLIHRKVADDPKIHESGLTFYLSFLVTPQIATQKCMRSRKVRIIAPLTDSKLCKILCSGLVAPEKVSAQVELRTKSSSGVLAFL